jgi:hypothetical protein
LVHANESHKHTAAGAGPLRPLGTPAAIISLLRLALDVLSRSCVLPPASDDLVAADYYEQEIRYQAELGQLRRTGSSPVTVDTIGGQGDHH